jgi:hypothetical protein
MAAVPGDEYVYAHHEGLGFGAMALATSSGSDISAEMKELDLTDGTHITVLELDAESGWPLVQWTDAKGLGRITTIRPDTFDNYFVYSAKEES